MLPATIIASTRNMATTLRGHHGVLANSAKAMAGWRMEVRWYFDARERLR